MGSERSRPGWYSRIDQLGHVLAPSVRLGDTHSLAADWLLAAKLLFVWLYRLRRSGPLYCIEPIVRLP